MAKISLIVAVYNVGDYLCPCMESLRAQSLKDIEIICIDDGSSDESRGLLEEYARIDARIKVLSQENEGPSSARNAGLALVSSPLVLFVDADDMLHPDTCLQICATHDAIGADMVVFGASFYPEFAAGAWERSVLAPRLAYYPSFDGALVFEEASHPYAWRVAFATSFLERAHLRFDESLRVGEDELLLFEAYPQAAGVVLLPDRLYRYRLLREDSLMARHVDDEAGLCRTHIEIARKIFACWSQMGIFDTYASDLVVWARDFVIYHCMLSPKPARGALIAAARDLFGDYFTARQISDADLPPQLQALLCALAERADDERIVCLMEAYDSSISAQRLSVLQMASEFKGRAAALFAERGRRRDLARFIAEDEKLRSECRRLLVQAAERA